MLPAPGTPANVIAFHPYNPKIVVAGNNHIKMWDIEKGKEEFTQIEMTLLKLSIKMDLRLT